jgi:hypothetical protein
MGLSFTTAADSCSPVILTSVLRDSWPHLTLSDSRLPKPAGPDPRIYNPQGQGGPVIPPGTVFPLRRLQRLAGTTVKIFDPDCSSNSVTGIEHRGGPHIKHSFQPFFYCSVFLLLQFFHYCVSLCCRGSVLTKLLLSNGRHSLFHYSGYQPSSHNIFPSLLFNDTIDIELI